MNLTTKTDLDYANRLVLSDTRFSDHSKVVQVYKIEINCLFETIWIFNISVIFKIYL